MPIISSSAVLEAPEPDTMLIEDVALPRGFVQLPKAVLYARHLSRDAKLLYAVLLGYAWQEQRCFPGYQRLCADLAASENAVRIWMRELENAHLVSQRRRGQGRTNTYILHDLRTAQIAVQDHHKRAVVEPQEAQDDEEAVEKEREKEQSGLRNSRRSHTPIEEPMNKFLFTHSSVFCDRKRQGIEVFGRTTDQRVHASSAECFPASAPGAKRESTRPAEKGRHTSPSINSRAENTT